MCPIADVLLWRGAMWAMSRVRGLVDVGMCKYMQWWSWGASN